MGETEQTQTAEEVVQEVVQEEAKVTPVVAQAPVGYYLAEVPTNFAKVIALGDKQVSADELIIKMANALKEAGLLKD